MFAIDMKAKTTSPIFHVFVPLPRFNPTKGLKLMRAPKKLLRLWIPSMLPDAFALHEGFSKRVLKAGDVPFPNWPLCQRQHSTFEQKPAGSF